MFVSHCLVLSAKMALKIRRYCSFSGHQGKIGEVTKGRHIHSDEMFFDLWTTNILQVTVWLIL